MSPELEQLLAALYESDTCEPGNRTRCEQNLRRLIDEVLERTPGLSREHLLDALRHRYREFVRTQTKPTALPPKA